VRKVSERIFYGELSGENGLRLKSERLIVRRRESNGKSHEDEKSKK